MIARSEPSPLIAPLLEDRAAADQPAVTAGDTILTYAELRNAIATTAEALRRAGVRPGDRVAMSLPKSIEALTLILGTLAIGAAYVPLNHRLPATQLHAILAELRPRLFVTTAATAATLDPPTLPGLRLALSVANRATPFDHPRQFPGTAPEIVSPADMAAMLYTSGTTGEPKGIMLSHQGMTGFVDWAADTFQVNATDHASGHAPFHFDLSVFDIFATLRRHATLHLLDDLATRFPGAMRALIQKRGVSVWYSVPTALAQLQARRALRDLASLRLVLFAGEVFPLPILRQVMADIPNVEFANLYGPTETNVCTWYRVPTPPATDLDTLPIGQACAHCEITVRDIHDVPVARGRTGEICVAGPAVMLGYWQQPEKTAASRVNARPDSYRTGDLGYLRDDGNLMLVGRVDQQVKLRGYRIELLALEATLNAHPAVQEAVAVTTQDAADGQLTVFVSPRDAAAEPSDLRDFITTRLAPYYLPDRFEWLPELPRTANGKADRSALRQRALTSLTK
jgi:amino acid adenylation domain-containing protein